VIGMDSMILLCSGDWILQAGSWVCDGSVTQTVYSAPVEYTWTMAARALFEGVKFAVPLMAVAWGGRQIIAMLR